MNRYKIGINRLKLGERLIKYFEYGFYNSTNLTITQTKNGESGEESMIGDDEIDNHQAGERVENRPITAVIIIR